MSAKPPSSPAMLRSHRVPPGQRKQQRRPSARGAETRAQVVEAAVECICEEGFAATTMDRIVERAGVTWGVLQYHFGDRGGLLSAVLEAGYENLENRLNEIEIVGDSLEKRVGHLVDTGWKIFSSPIARACFEIILSTRSEMAPRSASQDRLLAVARDLSAMTDSLLSKTVRGSQAPKRAKHVLIAALRGFAFERMQYPSAHDYKLERRALTEVLTGYLAQFDTDHPK